MPSVDTSLLNALDATQQIYNALDCCVTFEVFEALQHLTNQAPEIYSFERALQAPALEMMMRGFLLDDYARQRELARLVTRSEQILHLLNRLAHAVWGKPLNPRSQIQLQEFFYTAMRLPQHWTSKKGVRKLSMDRDSLEKLEVYLYARPIVSLILTYREIVKLIEVLRTEVSFDGRMRTSYNIAGTESGRWSSSSASDGTGGNLQNITGDLRYIFISDPGWKLCGIDLEQAESREVGWQHGILFDDWTYLNACYAGDLHTTTAQLVWPKLSAHADIYDDNTGKLVCPVGTTWAPGAKTNRPIAEQVFYRHYTYRDMSKRGGHGCLTPDHEVLTRNGWVSITTKPDEILTWNENTSEFSSVQSWTDHDYTGELQNFEGNSMSMFMTHDHRVPYRSDNRSSIREAPAEKGPGRYMPLGHGYKGGNETPPAKLIAAFMCDGHQKSINVMEFHFHKERKIARLKSLCEEYGYTWYVSGAKIMVSGNLPKYPGSFMFNWTTRALKDFLLELRYWDGHVSDSDNVSISSTREQDLKWFQTFGRICGIGGKISGPYVSGFGSVIYRLSQNNRQWATGKSVQWCKKSVENQRVLCPTVSSGWFYVRRNGLICVTGNTSYYGQPFTMARHLKVPVSLMEDFQKAFFKGYPAFQSFFKHTATVLQTTQKLTTPFGRTRQFFGRPGDDTTLREAIAFVPQSSTADRMNLILWRIWKYMGTRVRLMAQVHDAIYFQYREGEDEVALVKEALGYFDIPMSHNGHHLVVPGEAKVGWNWGNYHPKTNPNGLMKLKGPDSRVKQETALLDRVIC